ncbi:hypothetical protein DL98DRAFT_633770 [Cadophora sp. DSE1049]|nr:hypothetical protein DL98DRAFT_633770 [Cadophora sp. DSE1049]
MVSFITTALVASTILTRLVSADCGFSIRNINNAVMGSGCARDGGEGSVTIPGFGPATFTVSNSGNCGLRIVSRNADFPASAFDGWTVSSDGPQTCSTDLGPPGGPGDPVVPPGTPVVPPGTPPGTPVVPPGGGEGGGSGNNKDPRKCKDRERCGGPQGCCTMPTNGACPFRKECSNFPCDSCCGIPQENWTSCSIIAARSRKPPVMENGSAKKAK